MTVFALVMSLGIAASPEPSSSFETQLVNLARDEMAIVERLAFLRQATEKLSDSWQAEITENYKETLTKQQLLNQITEMELSAADRWSLLLNNLAQLHTPEASLTASAKEWRLSLAQLPGLHRQINDKLNEFNERLKAGILLNLAKKIQVQTSSSATPVR